MKIKEFPKKIKTKREKFMSRRTHRSFSLTRKRDYRAKLKLSSNFSFSKKVLKLLWSNRGIFTFLALFYGVLTFLLVGIVSQDTYQTFRDTIGSTSGDLFSGAWGEIGKAGLLFATAITGNLSDALSEAQQVYAGLLLLLTWLASVWLLRNILANRKVKLRDALYNSGSPILSTFLVVLLLIVQLLPVALAVIGFAAASATGLLTGGVEAMLFWFVAALLTVLSAYWITSTIFALVIVTLPGMYPMKAIKAAGDIMNGRRLTILLRFVWMGVGVLLFWAVIMVPLILLDSWVKGIWPAIAGFPTVPILILVLSTLTVIWISSFVYLLYREVVDNDPELS